MPGRKVEFRRPDGTLTTDKSAAIRVSRDDVAAAVAGSLAPASYYQGTAKHEANFAINEVDTEPSGFKSYGIFQISEEEAGPYGGLGSWWELDDAARVFVPVAEKRANTIASWFGTTVDQAPRDLWAWLAFAHNRGMGSASTTKGLYAPIHRHGLDGWADYKKDNPGDAINSYGDDCLPGLSLSKIVEAADEDPISFVGGLIIAGLIGGAAWWALERYRKRRRK